MKSPRVSVITATYNWSSVLRYAIQSVLWQDFQDFEMLVIGDGCTDDTAAVVASFGDPRLHWHNLPENSGSQSAPNNAGIERARGEYVAYLGHDDLWLPDHLSRLVTVMERTDADVAYTVLELIGPPGTEFRAVTGLSESGSYEFGMLVPPSSVMHRRAMAGDTGGWKDYTTIVEPPDREFLNRAWAAGKRFVSVPKLTVCKFPSAWRRNSYRERRSDEQAAYAARIAAEPDFLANELHAILTSYVLERSLPILHSPIPEDVPPGWHVRQSRIVRGLEPDTMTEQPVLVDTSSWGAAGTDSVSGLDLRPERYVRSLERAVQDKERQFAEVEAYARSLEAHITAREAGAAEMERYIASLRQVLAERDRQFTVLEEYAAALREHVALHERARADAESYAVSLQGLLAEKEDQLAEALTCARSLDAGPHVEPE
jgi:Glycosyl transferase family 2